MSPILLVIAAALVVGLLAGGSLRRLVELRVNWWGLALGGLVLQVLPVPRIEGVAPDLVGPAMLIGSYLLLLSFVIVNRWLPGAGVMALGLLLNLSVVAANGGMPVSAKAASAAGGAGELVIEPGQKHNVMTEETVLKPLADVIPVPGLSVVISVGDVLLYGAVGWLVVALMRGRSRGNPRPLAPWFPTYRGKHAPAYWRLPARYRRSPAPDRSEPPGPPASPAAAARSGT
jgi:hypothetical protein